MLLTPMMTMMIETVTTMMMMTVTTMTIVVIVAIAAMTTMTAGIRRSIGQAEVRLVASMCPRLMLEPDLARSLRWRLGLPWWLNGDGGDARARPRSHPSLASGRLWSFIGDRWVEAWARCAFTCCGL